MNDLTTQRLITNALWRQLRDHRWRGPTSTRRLSDHGNQPPQRAITNGRIPRAPSLNDTIRQTSAQGIAAIIEPDERNGLKATHYVVLYGATYNATITSMSTAARERWHDALRHATAAPYVWQKDGHAKPDAPRYHLIKPFEPFFDASTYATLHALADAATTWTRTPGAPELIEDHEVPTCYNEAAPAR